MSKKGLHNPFPHPMVKVSGNAYVESVVYEKASGKRILCFPVDGKEMVEAGGYSFDPPVTKVDTPAAEPESNEVAEPVKRAPGRPRKAD